MKEVMSGSDAVAHAAKLCRPEVVAAYPVTPQSHITEKIAEFVADGEMDAQYVKVESEFSAISCCVGASAAGARVFTATASQGLALMHEVLFAASGMRLPIVMPVANRALSAPINIWNDWQDSISQRDTGWLQLYCETNQEALDTTIQAYKIAENPDVLLPVIVNLDGFYITHTHELVDVPDQKNIDSFIGTYEPEYFLNPKKPLTMGPFVYPDYYYKIRHQLEDAIQRGKDVFKGVDKDFGRKSKRRYGILEKTADSDTLIMSMGSLVGTCRAAAEKLDCGVLKLKMFRPFPKEEIKKAVEGAEKIIIIEKDVSYGMNSGVLYSEIRDLLYDAKDKPEICGFIAGLGGKDVGYRDVMKMVEDARKGKKGGWYP